ncbi:hypothetical protein E4191_23105 (plasmid) [Paracoccus liaowanqingii]|uniref:Uncharacterized protein n=1 Tax=Paracoccus liaowanqingii TaxID=2560053 RepID=A0A4Y5SVZ6_9RHOB|nr:hypothetical protein [Paracoccus liaowanqingii]QDA36934.1 hypothetical protein E4191_23105 [Paracoccus liaowanqingii]
MPILKSASEKAARAFEMERLRVAITQQRLMLDQKNNEQIQRMIEAKVAEADRRLRRQRTPVTQS